MVTVLDSTAVAGVRRLYRLSFVTAIVSGVCCAVLSGILFINYFSVSDASFLASEEQSYRQEAADSFNLLPANDKNFAALKKQLAADKENEQLKERIRQFDQQLRNDFFRRRTIHLRTAPLLLITAIVFFASMRMCNVLKRPLPQRDAGIQPAGQATGTSPSSAVLVLPLLLVGVAAGMLLTPSTALEKILIVQKLEDQSPVQDGSTADNNIAGNTAGADETGSKPIALAPPLPPAATADAALKWTSFRGADGNGIGVSDKPPLKWNAVTGENVVWKTEIPLPGKSSPILWDTKLFITGADEKTQHIYCFNAVTGQQLWSADATKAAGSIKVSEDTGFAAPTPVTDGQIVAAMFANGELAAADFAGKIVWRKSFGVPESSYGYAASPAIHNGKVIVQYDVGDGSEPKSKIIALDTQTGKTVWETPRDLPNSWSSPSLQKIGSAYQIITCADPYVIAYNPDDGKEIWRCKCLSADVGPSPIASGNVVVVTNQSPRTTAIDATGSGDVTATHILWQGTNALPDTPSPFAAAGRFFTFDSSGYLTSYDPKAVANKRAKFWELEIGGGESSFYASPLCVGNRVYLFSRTEGAAKAFVVDLSKAVLDDAGALTEESAKAMMVAENLMPEPCVSSPAVVGNRLYIRGTKTLLCIEEH